MKTLSSQDDLAVGVLLVMISTMSPCSSFWVRLLMLPLILTPVARPPSSE